MVVAVFGGYSRDGTHPSIHLRCIGTLALGSAATAGWCKARPERVGGASTMRVIIYWSLVYERIHRTSTGSGGTRSI